MRRRAQRLRVPTPRRQQTAIVARLIAPLKHKKPLSDGASFLHIMQYLVQREETLGQCARGDRHHQAERPNWGKQPAQVKSHGKPESTRRPHGEPRLVWSRLDCLKPNSERLIKRSVVTSVLRRRATGDNPRRLGTVKTAGSSNRGDEPGSRDEWAT